MERGDDRGGSARARIGSASGHGSAMERWIPAAIVACLPACAAARPVAADPVVVPFAMEHGLVFLELELAGSGPALALLDTGANASAIDPRRAQDLPLFEEATVQGTTGTFAVEMVMVEGARLGSLPLPALRATRRDLSGLLAPEGCSVDLILGSDALLHLAVTIDFAAGLLELTAPPPRSAPQGVPMVLDDGIPAIEASLGGLALWLRIDTGASLFETSDVYVNVPARTWEALRARHPGLGPETHFQGTGADGRTVELPVARIPGGRVGPLELDQVFVIVQPEAGYFAEPHAKGFVGNNYLRRLGRVTLDYAAGRLRKDG